MRKNDDIPKFNKSPEENGEEKLKEYVPVEINKTQFDEICQEEWFMSEQYSKT